MLERVLAPAENEEAYDYDDFFKGNETLQRASVESFRRKVGRTNELDLMDFWSVVMEVIVVFVVMACIHGLCGQTVIMHYYDKYDYS